MKTTYRYKVNFAIHKPTGLWKVESPDIKGLLAFDKSLEALERETPAIAKVLLEADGKHVYDVSWVEEDENGWERRPNASLQSKVLQAA